MRHIRIVMAALALPLAACSRAPKSSQDVRIGSTPQTPEMIARLEKARADAPNSAPAARALGISYWKAGRFQDAKVTLDIARRLDPNDGVTALYLGLTSESLEDIAGAREAYSRYLATGKTKAVRNQIQARIAFLNRKELEIAAKQSIARETELASQPGAPTTVAVMPLRFTGSDTSLVPLERGIADLLVTDLGRVSRLTVVERDRVQALLDELDRSGGNRADSTTALRSGRLVRAGRIVQGSINQTGDQQIQLNAAIVDAGAGQVTRTARADDKIDELFAMEKRLALDIIDGLGIQLTPRERRDIEQRPTGSLAAFLAYSRGLQEEDRGNFDRATQFYNQATRIDPGFAGAAARGARTAAASSGASVSSSSVESSIKSSSEGAAVTAAENGTVANNNTGPSTQGTLSQTTNSLNPSPTATATQSGATNSGQTNTTPTSSGTVSNGSGGTTSAGTPPPAPPTNGAPTATGNNTPTTTSRGVITIIIKPPTE